MASNNTAGIAQARKLVEQLKMEANVDRMKVVGFCVFFFFLNATFAHFMQKKKKKNQVCGPIKQITWLFAPQSLLKGSEM